MSVGDVDYDALRALARRLREGHRLVEQIVGERGEGEALDAANGIEALLAKVIEQEGRIADLESAR